jgi:ribosome-associated protein
MSDPHNPKSDSAPRQRKLSARPASPQHNPEAHRVAQSAVEFALDRKALDVVVLDLTGRSSITDYFVVCTGRSDIQVQAICESVTEGLRKLGVRPLSSEGLENGQWALLDYGDVIVHVFQKTIRELYDLERLWHEAPRWTYDGGSVIGNPRT